MAEAKTRRRRSKKLEYKNYDVLIELAQKDLERLHEQRNNIVSKIKSKSAEIRRLEKEKIIYEEQKAEEEKAKKLKEVSEMIVNSGKSLDEIKEFLSK